MTLLLWTRIISNAQDTNEVDFPSKTNANYVKSDSDVCVESKGNTFVYV